MGINECVLVCVVQVEGGVHVHSTLVPPVLRVLYQI